MSRAPIETRPSTAQWLITAREAAGFTNAMDFLEAVKAAEGKAPSYSTYAQWESGSVTPRSSTLTPIRHFHEARQPKGTKAPEPAPDLPTALLALANELRAAREGRDAAERKLEAQARAIEALSDRLAALEGEGSPVRSTPHG